MLSSDAESTNRFERSMMVNYGFDTKLEGVVEAQRQVPAVPNRFRATT